MQADFDSLFKHDSIFKLALAGLLKYNKNPTQVDGFTFNDILRECVMSFTLATIPITSDRSSPNIARKLAKMAEFDLTDRLKNLDILRNSYRFPRKFGSKPSDLLTYHYLKLLEVGEPLLSQSEINTPSLRDWLIVLIEKHYGIVHQVYRGNPFEPDRGPVRMFEITPQSEAELFRQISELESELVDEEAVGKVTRVTTQIQERVARHIQKVVDATRQSAEKEENSDSIVLLGRPPIQKVASITERPQAPAW